jgi:hypothetical protein
MPKNSFLCVVLFGFWLVANEQSRGQASDSVIQQTGNKPILFEQPPACYCGINYLMASTAEHNALIDNKTREGGWKKMSDYYSWTISIPKTARYHVTALITGYCHGGNLTAHYKLFVVGTGQSITFNQGHDGWDRIDAGTLTIPAGVQQLKLVLATDAQKDTTSRLSSLELVEETAYQKMQERAKAFKADATWLADAKYGLMFQYGPWGAPKHGPRKGINQQAEDFDVPAFVQKVKTTGASYVIWSITWVGGTMDAPIKAVQDIVGNESMTSKRDLVGDIARALKKEGIHFCLYYQGFGYCDEKDRPQFFKNVKSIIADIGARYGTNLDAFFFDGGGQYYGGPLEEISLAARTGNPARLISYNDGGYSRGPRGTDFQDVWFGEDSLGESPRYGTIGPDGRFLDGPHQGLLQHGMNCIDNSPGFGWGVSDLNRSILFDKKIAGSAVASVQSAMHRHNPLSYNMCMWEDGTMCTETLNALQSLRRAIYPAKGAIPAELIDDSYPSIKYEPEQAWTYKSSEDSRYYNCSIHESLANKSPSIEFDFVGTGIGIIGTKGPNRAAFDVYLDEGITKNIPVGSGSFNGDGKDEYQSEVYKKLGLPNGHHKVRVAFKPGNQTISFDAFKVYDSAPNISLR